MQDACISVEHVGFELGVFERAEARFDVPCFAAQGKVEALANAADGGTQTEGSCWYLPLVSQHGQQIASPSAGRLTFVGPAPEPDVEPFVLEYNPDDQLYVGGQLRPFYNGTADADVAVQAAGGEVPAFAGTLRLPGPTRLIAPSGPGVGAITVRRSADTVFSWQPTSAGRRVVFVAEQALVQDDPDDRRMVACDFDGSAGTGTVPKALLSNLLVNELGPDRANLFVADHTVVSAGRFRVTLEGANYLLGNDDLPYHRSGLIVTE